MQPFLASGGPGRCVKALGGLFLYCSSYPAHNLPVSGPGGLAALMGPMSGTWFTDRSMFTPLCMSCLPPQEDVGQAPTHRELKRLG